MATAINMAMLILVRVAAMPNAPLSVTASVEAIIGIGEVAFGDQRKVLRTIKVRGGRASVLTWPAYL